MKPALSLAQIYQAIIIAFLAGLPFSFGSLGLTLYYYAIIILLSGLSLTACIRHRQQLLHQGRQYPVSLFLFASWIFFMLAAWLINLDLQHPLQPLLSSYRLLFDLLMIIICIGAACVQVDTKAKPSSWFLALVAGTLCMFVFHSWAFHQLDHSHLNWARNPPLGPNIRDQDKLAGCSAITLLSLLWFKPASTPIRVIYSMALIACVTFLIWASARNSLLALSIMAIAMFAFGFKQLRQQKVLALVPILVTIIAMSLTSVITSDDWRHGFALFSHADHLRQSQQQAEASYTVGDAITSAGNGRVAMWQVTVAAIKDNLWFGKGSFGYFFIPDRTADDQPHNFILQFLISWGFFASISILSLLLIFAGTVLKQLPNKIASEDIDWLIAAALLGFLTITGLFSGTYFKIQPFTILTLAFGVLLADMLNLRARIKL